MTVAKELKSMSVPVIINISKETGQLPNDIQAAYRGAGGAMPIVVLTDPAMTKIYGTYSHAQLKGQDYRAIFRDAKRDVSADIKAKTFNVALDAPAAKEEAAPVAKNDEKAAPADDTESYSGDVVKVENPQVLNWTSSKGTSLKAQLTAVEDGKVFVFKTTAGRIVRVPGDQLSATSLADARLIAGLE
jgi:RNase P/RNase MRP subunit p29